MLGKPTIKGRERDAVLSALRAGVVPRLGLQHVQVGRQREVAALVSDVDRVADGGSTCRFVIGEYGAGKTFFVFLVRQIALQRKLVVMQADLGPDRRIHATGGQARTLYAELARSTATRTMPEGNAAKNVLEGFIHRATGAAAGKTVEEAIKAGLGDVRDMVGGHDFAAVVTAYARGYDEGNDDLQAAALRWLRGEYATRTDARGDLGVRTIIDDATFYDALRLFARLSRLAGFSGLLVCLDEMVNLYKLQSAQARRQNYEQLLRILNDVLQGTTEGLGFVFGGTPEFLLDTRRGLYSYEALQSRLAANAFATGGLVDLSGPVVRLQNLTPEELYHLLERVRDVYASGDGAKHLVPDEGLRAFMDHCRSKLGEAYFRTPRSTIKAFADLLAVLEQNPGTDWRERLGVLDVEPDEVDEGAVGLPSGESELDDDLATLRL